MCSRHAKSPEIIGCIRKLSWHNRPPQLDHAHRGPHIASTVYSECADESLVTKVECAEVAVFDTSTDNDVVSVFHNSCALDIHVVLIRPEPGCRTFREFLVKNGRRDGV